MVTPAIISNKYQSLRVCGEQVVTIKVIDLWLELSKIKRGLGPGIDKLKVGSCATRPFSSLVYSFYVLSSAAIPDP